MSRLGRKPIELPKGVTVNVAADKVSVKGPKGELKRSVPAGITVKVAGTQVTVSRGDSDERDRKSVV